MGTQEVLIGRAMDCAIRTDDAMVSRHHARIYWDGAKWVVEDLGSANGVFYQEQRVSRHGMSHGDAVRCGSLWLRFVDSGGHPPPSGAIPAIHQGNDPAQAAAAVAAAQPFPRPAAQPAVNPAAQAVPSQDRIKGGMGSDDAGEIMRQRRRIEQLQTELRMYRRGSGADTAQKLEDLENENIALEEQVGQLESRVQQLEDVIAAEGADVKMRQATELIAKTSETVQQLNDVLSNLRINVMAAEGEFEQFAHQLPRASFELIREALRSSSRDVDASRELLRALRDLAD